MSAEMTADKPYSAPDADLGDGHSELYSPSIISFNGRIGRIRYLAYSTGISILAMLVMIPLGGASALMGGAADVSSFGVISISVLSIAALVFTVMYGKRRLNDLNRSGWWLLVFLVPVVSLLLTIYMVFFPGTDGENDFGAEPDANSIGVKILGLAIPVLSLIGVLAAVILPALA
jgi:uncharacterized membrane protein YhaH (DUF805 family)